MRSRALNFSAPRLWLKLSLRESYGAPTTNKCPAFWV